MQLVRNKMPEERLVSSAVTESSVAAGDEFESPLVLKGSGSTEVASNGAGRRRAT